MEKKTYVDRLFSLGSNSYSNYKDLIKEICIQGIKRQGIGLNDSNVNVYFCLLNDCGLVINEEEDKYYPRVGFTIAHENSLEKIIEAKGIIEKRIGLELHEIK